MRVLRELEFDFIVYGQCAFVGTNSKDEFSIKRIEPKELFYWQ